MLKNKILSASGNVEAVYVDDVFSTWLYTGNGSTQTITNGIDLAGNGGLVWLKTRNVVGGNQVFDTLRGINKQLETQITQAEATASNSLIAFNNNGFTLGTNRTDPAVNYTSWTFRKQEKFFDVVTYTGNGSNRTISHNLGSAPGCVIVKRTDTTGNWQVYHRGLSSAANSIQLNLTNAQASATTVWNSTAPTSSVFSVGTDATVNASGGTYVAYLFAHNAGGFGATGSDNVISCGSFTASMGSLVNLGYEPQWVLIKKTNGVDDWLLFDNMRGMTMGDDSLLNPNTSGAENNSAGNDYINPQPTGFTQIGFGSGTYIYIAIRRPMKPPTSGTSVFGLNARTGTGANATVTGGLTADSALIKNRGSAVGDLFASRLTGTRYLETSSTAAEVAAGTTILQANPWDVMDGVKVGTTSTITNASSNTFINYLFRRAPGFFDVVCYTGTGVAGTRAHNLAAVPELVITKRRSAAANWGVLVPSLGVPNNTINITTGAAFDGTSWWGVGTSTGLSSTTFGVGIVDENNAAGSTYVAYLFASLPGISQVGTYTGNGSSQTINCGFAAGARFVMIKRTDSTGDWYVWDTARGINPAGTNDPYLALNTTAAEVTNNDSLSAQSVGFGVIQNATTNINVNAASYIFLAVA